MTTIINLLGGPGAGKSTSAAYLFFKLKEAHKNTEIISEYAKSWAWDQRPISAYDQLYFLGHQSRKESMLFNKVDYIITDSPLYLNAFYSNKHCPEFLNDGIQKAILAFYKQAFLDGHNHVNIMLKRNKPYNKKGRYQTEEEAIIMDSEIKNLLDNLKVNYITYESDQDNLDKLLKDLNIF